MWQSGVDAAFPKGVRAHWENVCFSRWDDEVVGVLGELAAGIACPGTGIAVHHLEGVFGRVPEEATAFPARSFRHLLTVYGTWREPAEDERRIAFVRRVRAAVEPFAQGGGYVNYLGVRNDDDVARAALQSYGPDKHQRLVALKTRYDPANLFRRNVNIAPDRG